MRGSATNRPLAYLLSLFFAVLAVSAGARAEAQVNPLWDHYKVYFAPTNSGGGLPVVLQDQFGVSSHVLQPVYAFANPVEKILPDSTSFPINDPRLHYVWWSITPQPLSALVAVTNQFGDQTLNVHEALMLLTPALKNEPTTVPLPDANHYKCYSCDGQPVNQRVTLRDQFDTWTTTPGLIPRFLCNPAEKRIPGGPTYPIRDERQHYVCYEFQPPDPNLFPAFIRDQFITFGTFFNVGPSRLLCVPTDKLGVTPAQSTTWGRIKRVYR